MPNEFSRPPCPDHLDGQTYISVSDCKKTFKPTSYFCEKTVNTRKCTIWTWHFSDKLRKNIGQINLAFKIFDLDFSIFSFIKCENRAREKFWTWPTNQSWENDLTNQKPRTEQNDWFQDGVNGLFVRSDLYGYFYFYGLVHWFTDFEN